MIFHAEVEMRAGMLMSLRRIVPLRALSRSVPAREPTARERLNAIVASTRQAALAVMTPEEYRVSQSPNQCEGTQTSGLRKMLWAAGGVVIVAALLWSSLG